jgi:hypothetical protein
MKVDFRQDENAIILINRFFSVTKTLKIKIGSALTYWILY